MKKEPAFPFRLWRWFLGRQILVTGLYLIFLNLVLLIWLDSRSDLLDETRAFGRLIIFWALASSFLIMVAVSVLMARRLVVPLGRLIEKTKRISRFPFEDVEISPQELAFDEPGEWYELEKALNKLGTDLKEKTIRLSREKTELRTLMSSVTEAVLAVDLNRVPMFFNPQFALLFGVRESAPASLVISDFVRSPEILRAYDQCLSQGISSRLEVHLQLQEGASDFLVSVVPLRKKHNQELYGAVATFYDITELKMAEKIRIEFVGNVSHELRTPLTSIKGYLQTVKLDYQSGRMDQISEFLEIISKNVDRLILLVGDLLDLSSLESGARLSRNVVSTRDLTESILNQVNVRDHQVKVFYGLEEFEADAPRVEQVLGNLLQNAVRYVPKGKPIEIHWESDESGKVAILKVKDYGPGIPKQHHERLFERFYRIDEARSRELGGSGIGLSLVKHIMQRHGGRVQLRSEMGLGSEFICEFPQDLQSLAQDAE